MLHVLLLSPVSINSFVNRNGSTHLDTEINRDGHGLGGGGAGGILTGLLLYSNTRRVGDSSEPLNGVLK